MCCFVQYLNIVANSARQWLNLQGAIRIGRSPKALMHPQAF